MSRQTTENNGTGAKLWRRWLVLLAVVAAAVGAGYVAAGDARAQEVGRAQQAEDEDFEADRTLIAGSEQMLFAARVDRDQGRFELRFAAEEELEQLLLGWGAHGEVVGLAAHDETAYLVYGDHSVQAMQWRGPQPQHPQLFEVTQLPPLPRNARLLEMQAVGPRELLVVLGPTEQTAAANAPPPPPPADFPEPRRRDEAATDDNADPPAPHDTSVADRTIERLTLMRLTRNRWETIDWPADVTPEQFVSLAASPRNRATLLSRTEDDQGVRLHTWHADQEAEPTWEARSLDIAPTSWMRSPMVQQMRLILAADEPAGPIDVYVARSGGQQLGQVPAIETAERAWVTPTDGRLTLIFADDEQLLGFWQWNLDGQPPAADTVTPIELADMPALTFEPVVWLLIAAMVIALLMLLATMGNAEVNAPRLPPTLRPAGVPRIWAAVIDFVPALAISMIIFGIRQPQEILGNWPLLTDEMERMPPAAVAIGIHVLHTMLGELLTGRSLGKWIMGCRVVNLVGEKPRVWQILSRNGLKIIELAIPYLLVLPILPSLLPYQQRLGDLIGRTLVVSDVPEDEQQQLEQERKQNQPPDDREES